MDIGMHVNTTNARKRKQFIRKQCSSLFYPYGYERGGIEGCEEHGVPKHEEEADSQSDLQETEDVSFTVLVFTQLWTQQHSHSLWHLQAYKKIKKQAHKVSKDLKISSWLLTGSPYSSSMKEVQDFCIKFL